MAAFQASQASSMICSPPLRKPGQCIHTHASNAERAAIASCILGWHSGAYHSTVVKKNTTIDPCKNKLFAECHLSRHGRMMLRPDNSSITRPESLAVSDTVSGSKIKQTQDPERLARLAFLEFRRYPDPGIPG
jgi:hypothetical protein